MEAAHERPQQTATSRIGIHRLIPEQQWQRPHGIKAMSQIMAGLDELESRQYIWRDPGRRRGIKAIRLPNYCKCPTCGALMEKTENVSKAGAI
jgi:hypothetical protein